MKKKVFAFLLIVPVAITLMFQLNSCNAPQPSKGKITVKDSAGNKLLSNVHVQLYANVTYNNQTTVADLKADGYTGSDGTISFSFKNPCVMDVKATVGTCTVNPGAHVYCNGSGIVKFEEGKTAEKTIRIDH